MKSEEMKFQISNSLTEPLERYANQVNLSLERVLELLLQWMLKEFESRSTMIQSKFDHEQLEWFKEHINVSDLLSISSVGEFVHLLKTSWVDSSFEEEIDLSTLFDSLLTLTEQELVILSWWLTK